MELKLLIKIKFLMDSIIFLLKLGPSLHLQFQPFPKILNSSWMSQKQCCRNILFKVKNQRKLLIVQKVKKHLSFIHNYENYCNIAWAITTRTKLDKILKKQKHAMHIIYNIIKINLYIQTVDDRYECFECLPNNYFPGFKIYV